MNNKAQGRTFWIVVTAVVALVVLIILLVIFTGKTGKLESGLLGCESKGGFCYDYGSGKDSASSTLLNKACKETSGKCGSGKEYSSCSYSSAFSCSKTTEICCLGIKSNTK